MKQAFWVVFMLIGLAQGTRADTVTLKGAVLEDVAIVDALDGELVLEKDGRQSRVPMAEIERIKWDAHDNFNRAEEQRARGMRGTAVISYAQAIEYAKRDWEKRVIEARRAALTAQMESAAKAAAGAAHATSRANEVGGVCPVCGQKGATVCQACQGSGKVRCDKCNGAGEVVCPTCRGKWQGDKCNTCDGSGKVYATKDPGISIVAPKTCPDCGGTGRRFVCAACATSAHRGMVACSACGGTGYLGDCPVCKGRKVICPHCAAQADSAATTVTGRLWLVIGGAGVAIVLLGACVAVARRRRRRMR